MPLLQTKNKHKAKTSSHTAAGKERTGKRRCRPTRIVHTNASPTKVPLLQLSPPS